MSLSPQVRRERRAQAKKYREPKKFPRRRCWNCDGWFLKTRKNKRFCKASCKDEYNRHGSAFGPLKDYLTKLIQTASKEEAAKQFAAYVSGKDFRRQLAAAGFIHRSMIKRGVLEMVKEKVDTVLEVVTAVTRRVDVLTSRVARIEAPRPADPPADVMRVLDQVDTMRAAAKAAGVDLTGGRVSPTTEEATPPAPRRQRRPAR